MERGEGDNEPTTSFGERRRTLFSLPLALRFGLGWWAISVGFLLSGSGPVVRSTLWAVPATESDRPDPFSKQRLSGNAFDKLQHSVNRLHFFLLDRSHDTCQSTLICVLVRSCGRIPPLQDRLGART